MRVVLKEKRRKSGVLECGRLLWTGRVSVTSAYSLVGEQLKILASLHRLVQINLVQAYGLAH